MRFAYGVICVILAAACFGFMPTFRKIAIEAGANTNTMLCLRFTIAGVVMAFIMSASHRAPGRGRPRRGGSRWPGGKTLLGLSLAGGVLYVAEALCYFHGLKFASSGIVSLLLYLFPGLVMLMAWLLYNERFTATRVMALALAALGLVMTLDPQGGARPLGIALGVGSALFYAAYILLADRLTRRTGALDAAGVVMISAAIVLAVISLTNGFEPPQTLRGWSSVFGLAIVSTVIPITALLAGMERIGPVRTAMLSTLEPLITALLGAAILGERMTLVQSVGGLLIIAAAIIIASANNRRT